MIGAPVEALEWGTTQELTGAQAVPWSTERLQTIKDGEKARVITEKDPGQI